MHRRIKALSGAATAELGHAAELPEPVYVSRTASPVVVAASLLFKGSVFTEGRQKEKCVS